MSFNKLTKPTTSELRNKIASEERSLPVTVALVVPASNEEKLIETSINSLEHYISLIQGSNYKISVLIAEDGSSDSTLYISNTLSNSYNNIQVLHDPIKQGRGRAVKQAWSTVDADIYAYVDADMATNLSYLGTLLDSCTKGYHIATGSRYLKFSNVKRPFLRKFVSRGYNLMIDLLFKTKIRDHQCGFKAVTKDARSMILEESIFDDWFWDTEIFVIANRNGLRVREFPVDWQEKRGSKTPIKRLLKDIWIHGTDVVKLLLISSPTSKNST